MILLDLVHLIEFSLLFRIPLGIALSVIERNDFDLFQIILNGNYQSSANSDSN